MVVIWSRDILNEAVSVDGDVVSILLEVQLNHRTVTEVVLRDCVSLYGSKIKGNYCTIACLN